jgi:four helix bundle protein
LETGEGGRTLIADFGLRIADLKTKGPDMTPEELKKRTKDFALKIINTVESLPKSKTGDVIGRQLLRSGTSVGANYRSACRARSSADFISKMTIVEEEADESIYWMELLIEGGLLDKQRLNSNISEAKELLSITVSSINTARKGKRS